MHLDQVRVRDFLRGEGNRLERQRLDGRRRRRRIVGASECDQRNHSFAIGVDSEERLERRIFESSDHFRGNFLGCRRLPADSRGSFRRPSSNSDTLARDTSIRCASRSPTSRSPHARAKSTDAWRPHLRCNCANRRGAVRSSANQPAKMVKAGLEVCHVTGRNINLDWIQRAGRGRRTKMIVVVADPLLSRQAVSAEQDTRQRGRVYRCGKICRHVRRQRRQRRRRGKIEIARQRDRRSAGINLVRQRLVCPSPGNAATNARWCTNAW